jgi:hypothetical protein
MSSQASQHKINSASLRTDDLLTSSHEEEHEQQDLPRHLSWQKRVQVTPTTNRFQNLVT